ncbi:hypothetical protein ACJ41O_013421 [Fusarium nematophilum]
MSSIRPVTLFPCLFCWTPEVKCPNYVFLSKGACVDCQRFRREADQNELVAADVHETFVRYLIDKYSERGGITYEKINEYIYSARQVGVDNLLTVALDYIFRNFRGQVYHAVCDEVEAARDRGPVRWTPINLAERLEKIRQERERQSKGKEPDED